MYMRGTPGNSDGFSFEIAFSTMSISKRGTRTSLAAFVIEKFIASIPNEWKNGSAAEDPVLALPTTGNHAAAWRAFATQVLVREHRALREPGRAARVDQRGALRLGSSTGATGGTGPAAFIASLHQRTGASGGTDGRASRASSRPT